MFFFEREMSCRLLEAGRRRLPDFELHTNSYPGDHDWGALFQSIVRSMVRRGEFHTAVKSLADTLEDVLSDNVEELRCDISLQSNASIESFIIVIEALLVTLTENLIVLGQLPPKAMDNCKSMSLRSVTQWGMLRQVPALEFSTAAKIVNICKIVLPKGFIDSPITSAIGITPNFIVGDTIMTVCQYLCISNPSLMMDNMKEALEEDPTSRLELLSLASPNSAFYINYMQMVRHALPKLSNKLQADVILLVCGSLARGIMADPELDCMENLMAYEACKSLCQWVEKLRAFRPLRNLRPHEAIIACLLDIQAAVFEHKNPYVLNLEKQPKKEISSDSDTPPPAGSPVSSSNKLLHYLSLHSNSQSHDKDSLTGEFNLLDNGQIAHQCCADCGLLSLSTSKTFDRLRSIIKRDHSNDKKLQNFIAACQSLAIVGFVGWATSNRPEGKPFLGVALDVQPLLPEIMEFYQHFPKRYKTLILCFCADLDRDLFLKFLPSLESEVIFEITRTLQTLTSPQNFSNILSQISEWFINSLSITISNNNAHDLVAVLDMLIHVSPEHLPEDVILRVLNILCIALQTKPEQASFYERYVEPLYEKVSQSAPDKAISSLKPLIISGSITESFMNLQKVRNLYLYLKLASSGKVFIPESELQSAICEADIEAGIFEEYTILSVRTIILVYFCVAESTGIPGIAIKCLELLQGDIYYSATVRDMISELLDSIEHESLSLPRVHAHMCEYIARSPDAAFASLNRAVTAILDKVDNSFYNSASACSFDDLEHLPPPMITQQNLLMVKAALLPLESVAERHEHYKRMFFMRGPIRYLLSKQSQIISVEIGLEIFYAYRGLFEESYQKGVNYDILIDRAVSFMWFLDQIMTAHPVNSSELNLGDLCSSFMHLLRYPRANIRHEQCVLRLIGNSARYVSMDKSTDLNVFDSTIRNMLKRKWMNGSKKDLHYALTTILQNYKVRDDNDLLSSLNLVSSSYEDEKTVDALITLLFRNNIKNVIHLCNSAISLSHICRAASYDALAYELSTQIDENNELFDKAEMVIFLLEHIPILEAFCDVCSVSGSDSLSEGLLELFCSYSLGAERKLIAIALDHELSRTTQPSDFLRTNSVSVKIILEWTIKNCDGILHKVLPPILGTLRAATLRHYDNYEELFEDSLIRFEALEFPEKILWSLQLMREKLVRKFGPEVAGSAIANLLTVRFICPVMLAPQKYGLSSRAPAREYSLILRKYAAYLQNHKEKLVERIFKRGSSNNPSDHRNSQEIEFDMDADIDSKADKVGYKPHINSMVQHTSATRIVFHLLRRHAVEIRVVLFSRGYGGLVASMMQYLRLGKTIRASDPDENPIIQYNLWGNFRGKKVLVVTAQQLCTDSSIANALLNFLSSNSFPLLIDFTDFIGISSLWSETLFTFGLTLVKELSQKTPLIALNCPRFAVSSFQKISSKLSMELDTELVYSCDFHDKLEELPTELNLARMAAADVNTSVSFEVNVKDTFSPGSSKAYALVGAQFIQFKMHNSYEVFPYVNTHEDSPSSLVISMRMKDIFVSLGGIEVVIFDASPALKRVLKFSLDASQASSYGAKIYMSDLESQPTSHESEHSNKRHSSRGLISGGNEDKNYRPTHSLPLVGNLENHHKNILSTISPGRILYSTLLDILHPSEIVRKRAIELYAALHDTYGLQLNVPSLRESHKPTQVYSLAAAAASRHPEMAIAVATGLSDLEGNITECAARIASPWISQIDLKSATEKRFFRSNVIIPLLNAIISSPKLIGNALLEYFWPHLHDLPNIMSDLLLQSMKSTEDVDAREALRQVAANGIPLTRPHESQQLAEVTLARLYASFRTPAMHSSCHFYDHVEWKCIYNCALLFGSISVDYQAAETLFADMGFVLFMLARVGDFTLRNIIHEMLINYLNSFLQSPNLSATQCQRLRSVRTELNSDRCLDYFGINGRYDGDNFVDASGVSCLEFTAEVSEYLGRLLWEIIIGVFGTNITKYHEASSAIGGRIFDFVDIMWPPLQRRCILGFIGSVKFYMPESVVRKILEVIREDLSWDDPSLLSTQAELCNCAMRMCAETIECIPQSGTYQRHFFWVAVVNLATGSEALITESVRLILKSVRIEHFRGAFNEEPMSEVFIRARPPWISSIASKLPLDLPSSYENFHLALVQLLIQPFGKPESEDLTLECMDVLARACPNEIIYPIFIFLGGRNDWIVSRIPTGTLMDTDDTVLHWIVKKIKFEKKLNLLALGYAAYVSAYTQSENFSQIAQRMLNLVERIECRRTVYLIAPLLRPAFLRLLNLHDPGIEVKLVEWSSRIFSLTSKERELIQQDSHVLENIHKSYNLKPCFDEIAVWFLFDVLQNLQKKRVSYYVMKDGFGSYFPRSILTNPVKR